MQFFLTFQGKRYLFLLKTIDFMNKFDKKKFLIYIKGAGRQKLAGASRVPYQQKIDGESGGVSSTQLISNASSHDKRRYHRCHAYGRGAARKAEECGKLQTSASPLIFVP